MSYGHEFHHHAPPQLGHAPPGAPGGHEGSNLGISPEITGQVVKIFSEAGTDFNLAVSGDEIVIAKANDSDPFQQWVKDETWSSKAKDTAGYPGFSLINRGSGKALRHPPKSEEKVLHSVYHQKSLDEGYLWSMGADVGHGWHAIRPISNIKLNLDIDHGSKKYGGVKDGQAVIVFEWKDEENQHWKIAALNESATAAHDHHHRF